ncbi:hypothetical protein [Nocardiopsis sp. CA-288880]|uniref:hypothetical protein n=1 Tax=Nocardiopsis sp. CA-288880 TaxID=3239995 RepID=UPI003D96CCCC
MKRLFPYAVLAGEVGLEVLRARLDDVPIEFSMISGAQRTVALHEVERERWGTATLTVRVRLPKRELTDGPWTNVACAAVVSERRTNVRAHVPLEQDEPGVWLGEVTLHRERHVNKAELTAQVSATVDEIDSRLIGRSEASWTVDLLATTPTKKDGIRTEWVDFGGEEAGHLDLFRSDPWFVEAVGEEPTLYLNKRFEGIEAILRSNRAVDRPAQNALASQIAQEVWTVLFTSVVRGLPKDDQGRPEWPGGWQESTLRKMLPDVLPDYSLTDALAEIVAREDGGGGDIHARVAHAAAVQARRTRHLGSFLRAFRRKAQEEEQ